MTAILSKEEKERILRTLERDREFRYAMMGLLGFSELLERFARLEERFARLEERQQKLEERQQRLEERQQRLEERFARLEERFARLEERQQKLEERFAELEEKFARIEERQMRLEERQQKLEERFARVEEELRDLRRVVAVIGHRFGVISESSFRQAMRYVVEEALGAGKVEKVVIRDEEGIVYGHPSIVEVDVLVKDRKHILIEVKSRVSRSDVAEIYRIGELYRRVKGVRPELVIVGGLIDPDAYSLAAKLGVEIVPVVRDTGP